MREVTARCQAAGEQLAAIIDDQIRFEAEKLVHRVLTPGGQAIKDHMLAADKRPYFRQNIACCSSSLAFFAVLKGCTDGQFGAHLTPYKLGYTKGTGRETMCCVVTLLLLIGPRAAALVWSLVDPVRWQVTFDTPLLPILGLIFLPWTLLAYVLVAPGGVAGLDWLWLVLALLFDLGSTSGGAVKNRQRIRQYRG